MQHSSNRIDYLDAMRAVLMMLGIILHSAQLYNPSHKWLLHEPQSQPFFYYLIEVIRVFRMPAFFVVSGFFCAMLIQRYGSEPFMQSRLKKLLVPLLVSAVTLNVMQAFLLQQFGWLPEAVIPYLLHGGWVQHLWFLLDLLVFVFLLYLGYRLPRARQELQRLSAKTISTLPLLVLISLLPLYPLAMIVLNKLGLPMYHAWFGVMGIYELLYNLQFFLFGLMLYSSPKWLTQFSNVRLRYGTPALITLIALHYFSASLTGVVGQVLAIYSNTLLCWLSIALCFTVFNRLVTHSSAHWRFLSEASYTVYLFHHFIVIALGLSIMQTGLPPVVGYSLVVIATLLLTLAIHRYVIAPSRILRLGFNGK
ncbi:acyltransferase family protein [Rheinheimera baltica]|uniref:acyltransferase family protein n=1 Tax=Rheinheimera baltica TaxID=67576 RepID=UPI00274016D3|nr:acyltransferase family protein [Rheinheimera baltica]MDP5150888.1 acyltransferase family protein [Rheinheimera baltica]